jgi:hypothetical protein
MSVRRVGIAMFSIGLVLALVSTRAIAQADSPHYVGVDDPTLKLAQNGENAYSLSCGFIYDHPAWEAKKLRQLVYPCGTLYHDAHKVVGRDSRGIVEILQDTELASDVVLHVRDRFEYKKNPDGEGSCPVFIAGRPERIEVECVREPGFATLSEKTFRVIKPAGRQKWFRIVDSGGTFIGWYLSERYEYEPNLVEFHK